MTTAVGLALPQMGPHVEAETVQYFAERAEELGFASLWVEDHFLFPLEPERGYSGRPGVPVPDVYRSVLAPTELLAAVAAWTHRVRLGTSILVAGNHWPAQLASRLATVDVLSGGRLVVGLGVGWNAEEHRVVGVDPATRGRRMDDFIPALLSCWGEDPVRYEGPFFTIPPCQIRPKPLQSPRPPLLSGMWSPAGLDRTARWFDGWNPAGLTVDQVAEITGALQAQRPPGAAPLTVHHRVFAAFPGRRTGPPGVDGVIAEVTAAAEAGFDEVIIEAGFWDEIRSPDDWRDIPDRFGGALKAAAG